LSEPKRLRVVAALLVRDGPRFLAQQRLPGGPRGSLWEFPGGKVEPGEDDRAALAREIREELGCEVEVGEELAVSEHTYPDLALTLALYRCALRSGEPVPTQAQAVRWGTADELTALPFAEADLPFLPLLRTIGA
jgi:8-oxo-dGTP diphosphatase